MVAVAIAFVGLFLILASGTILAVVADDSLEIPDLSEFPLDGQAEIIDSMPTCTDSACDGHGVLLQGQNADALTLTDGLQRYWLTRGWEEAQCVDEGEICFAEDDLRISIRNWDQVDPLLAPTFVEDVADQGLDPARLLYAHYYRCDIIHPCE